MMNRGMAGPMMPGMPSPMMMCPRMRAGQTSVDLSTDDVKAYLENWIALSGNGHIKVGAVSEKDARTIRADIVTTDKEGLVQRFDVDRRTGQFQPARS